MSDRHLANTVPGRNENYFWGDVANKFIRNDCVCWITRTNLKTHDILRSGFKDSPMFSGRIHGKGPRYCPSIEDKINRFGDRDGHQLFLEPEQADIGRVYINGFSSSLPADIQLAAIHTIPGLTRARVLQIGYAVEYDSVDATQLSAVRVATRKLLVKVFWRVSMRHSRSREKNPLFLVVRIVI